MNDTVSTLEKSFNLPPFRAYQGPREYVISAKATGFAREFGIDVNTHDASWKRPGDGSGHAKLRFTTHAVTDPTLSLDITELWNKNGSDKTTERATMVTLPAEVAHELYAWLKDTFEPSVPDQPVLDEPILTA